MGKKIIGFSIENTVGYYEANCLIERRSTVVDEFDTPYEGIEVLVDLDSETEEIICGITVNGADRLLQFIENEDCLPDVGLLDYKEDELGLDLKDVTLRELYKEILKKIL